MGTSDRKYTPVIKFWFGFCIKPGQALKIRRVMIMREIEDRYLNGIEPWVVGNRLVELETRVSDLTVDEVFGSCNVEVRVVVPRPGSKSLVDEIQVTHSQQHALENMIEGVVRSLVERASAANSTIFDGVDAELEIMFRAVRRSICSEP